MYCWATRAACLLHGGGHMFQPVDRDLTLVGGAGGWGQLGGARHREDDSVGSTSILLVTVIIQGTFSVSVSDLGSQQGQCWLHARTKTSPTGAQRGAFDRLLV